MPDSKTILVADDVTLVRILVKNIMEKFGYKIIGEVANGLEACEKYFDLKPDLVIMDITMPVMDGIYATMKIIEKDSNAKIIICSAMRQAIIALECLKAGALDFICKPFSEQRLIEAAINAVDGKCNYNQEALMQLLNHIKTDDYNNIDSFQALSQEEMDKMLDLVKNNEADNINIDVFLNKIPNYLQSPDYFDSLRESSVDIPIIKAITTLFHELAENFADYFIKKTGQSYSLRLHCVEQSLNYDTRYVINNDVIAGIIEVKEKKLPIAMFSLQYISDDIASEVFRYVYSGLQPILPGDTSSSFIAVRTYLEKYNTVYAQVYISIELFDSNNISYIMIISIPHELAKTEEFRNKVLHWKLNRL